MMTERYSWDKFVTETKPSHKSQKQVTVGSNSFHEDIRKLISQLSPNAGSHVPDVIGAYICQQCGEEGFPLFNDWYKTATEYPDTEGAKEKYAACVKNKHPTDKSSILKLIDDNTEAHDNEEQTECFEKCDFEVIEPAETDDTTSTPTILDNFSLTGKSQELAAQQLEMVHVLEQIARTGESTVIFGAPNSGKTLLTLALTLESVHAKRIKPEDTYYIDHDDPHHALVEKVSIFEEFNLHVLADGYEGLNANNFTQQLDEICKRGQAHGKIIILDTLKKFVNVMDKRQVANWNKSIRRFTAKGGTVIALAHVNKKCDSNGRPIFSGVADLTDDCDTAFLIRKVNTDDETKIATVEFENIKRRGDVADSVGFSFSVDPKIGYEERLASVERVDPSDIEKIKLTEATKSDAELIAAAKDCIKVGINTKMLLRNEISKRTGISQRKAVQLIERYEGNNPAKHKWDYTVQERGKKVYRAI